MPRAEPHPGRLLRPTPPNTPIAESAGLAHDAGNLLGALRLYCDLLSEPGVLAPEHRHYAADLNLIASRSSALIRRLLIDTSVPQTPQPGAPQSEPAAAAPLNPAKALCELAPVLERIAAGVARVTVTTPATLPASTSNAQLPSAEVVERIAVNLVRNAAEAIRSSRAGNAPASAPFGTKPGQIRVALETASGHLRLTVEDDGPGMPPAIAAAFLRPDPLPVGATRGLGHRIVHELATATGALLSIRVRPGRGTTFCFRWPLPGRPNDLHTHPAHNANPDSARILPPLHRTASQTPGAA